jgi:hypothetical protein
MPKVGRSAPAGWRVGGRLVLLAAGATVAAVVCGVVISSCVGPLAPGVSSPGRVEITHVGLSLTIMSRPDWASSPAETTYGGGVLESGSALDAAGGSIADSGGIFSSDGVYGSDGKPLWHGLALVRDQRRIRDLTPGVSEVWLEDIPAQIKPDTVRLRAIDDPEGLAVLEQNFRNDLAISQEALSRHVGQGVSIVTKSRQQVEGTLLSFQFSNPQDNSVVVSTLKTLIIAPAGGQAAGGHGAMAIDMQEVRSIRFSTLAQGLLTKPALVWKLRNKAQRTQNFEVAYMTEGLSWRADYVLRLHAANGSKGEGREAKGETATTKSQNPEVVDTADLDGVATVTNRSGVTYENAQLKLIAGDVNIAHPDAQPMGGGGIFGSTSSNSAAPPSFQEKPFFEYHLYTLSRPATLRDKETKQIDLVSGKGLKMRRTYVYDPVPNETGLDYIAQGAARVVSELENSRANGLGVPLPAGVVRLYAPDEEGEEFCVGRTTIDHTPVDEKLRLPWGSAFDVPCIIDPTEARYGENGESDARAYHLRNHKDSDITVTAVIRVPKETFNFCCLRAWHIREVGVIEVQVPIKAGTEETVKYRYDFDTQNNHGGLKPSAPEDPDSQPSDPSN